MKNFIHIIIVVLLSFLSIPASHSADLGRLKVSVRDSVTNEEIPYAAVTFPGAGGGVLANEHGVATLFRRGDTRSVQASVMGYTTRQVDISPSDKEIVILLPPTGVTLKEVTVGRTKEKYRKKDNPAVKFVETLKQRSHLTDPRRHDNYNYDKYERFTIGLNNFTVDENDKWLKKNFNFLQEHIDTSEISGRPILNVAIRESSSEVNYRKQPLSQKEYVTGRRRAGIDDVINNQDNITEMLSDVFREIDLYQNDITIMQNRLVSPLSRIATDFYKFYLTDTVQLGDERCIVLSFVPHNTTMMGFTGRVYVPEADSTMFIRKVEMRVPRSINLNFIGNLFINQEFEKAPDGSRLKVKDDLVVELQLLPNIPGVYARRNTAYTNHNFNTPSRPEIFDNLGDVIVDSGAEKRGEDFWASQRTIAITRNEDRVEELVHKLRSVSLYYWAEKIVKILASGYIPTGNPSPVDIGEIGDIISSDKIEGLRLQLGYVTTARLNKHIFSRGYVAYGFRDHEWKYSGELEYSFNEKKHHSREFPVHSIKVKHQYDVDQLGQYASYFSGFDSFFSSITRRENNLMTYKRQTELEYKLELANNFSVSAVLSHYRQIATPLMYFTNGLGQSFSHFNQASIDITLRYAPGEKFYQGKTNRYPLNLDAPVFTLSHSYGPAGLLGSMWTVNRTEASIYKRFWFSAFGYLDFLVRGGHIWSQTPYTSLLTPNANITYMIQPESFALLNPMEFLMDTYGIWDCTYWLNGALMNQIPLIKRLKLREVLSFRGFMGHLSKKNDPQYHKNLFLFPEATNTQRMGTTPYMEVAVGLDNILKLFRVDYVWRLTYRNNPGIDRGGVRATIHLTF